MKGKKKLFIVIPLIVTIIFTALCSYGLMLFHKEREKQIAQWNDTVWFTFSDTIEYGEGSVTLSSREMAKYKSTEDVYNSYVYYNTLKKEEKIIYKAMQYAYDNNYVYFHVEQKALPESEYSLMDILTFLSLDSPVIQQNLDAEWYDHELTTSNVILGKVVERKLEGDTIFVDNFSEERTAEADKAVEKIKKWDLEIPEDADDTEKARAFYRYIDENIEYSSAKVEKGVDYLCLAVTSGKTNCDGFANTFSLLCNMNGIKCFEKLSEPGEEDEEGHTWNTVMLSGEWYHVDCTPAQNIESKDGVRELLRFGYSDEFQLDIADYEGVFPECNQNINPVACHLDACSSDNALSEITDAYRESENDWIIIAFDVFDEEECDLFQNVANRLYLDIDIITISGDEITLCYLTKK